MASSSNPGLGRYEYAGLDRIMHEKARLGIMTSLLSHSKGLIFNDLKELCSLTDGNLNRHIQVLHDAENARMGRKVVGPWKAQRRPPDEFRVFWDRLAKRVRRGTVGIHLRRGQHRQRKQRTVPAVATLVAGG